MAAISRLFIFTPTCPSPSSHSSFCKLQFPTKPLSWAFVFAAPTHTTPTGPIPDPDLKITTKQVDECKSVIKSSSVITL